MNPIISPLWFYLIHVVNTIQGLSFITLIISMIGLLLLVASGADFYADKEKNWRLLKKIIKIYIVVVVMCNLAFILIPDEKTIYMMLAASIVTPDNISCGEEHIINLITNIVNAINSAK